MENKRNPAPKKQGQAKAKLTIKAITIQVEGDPEACLSALRSALSGLLALPAPKEETKP